MLPKSMMKTGGKEDEGTADARRELEKMIEAEEKKQGQ